MDESFAARLRTLIDRAGLSQAELARRSSVDQATISRWLHGLSEPNIAQLRRALRALGASAAEALGEPPPRDGLRAVRSDDGGDAASWFVFRGERLLGEWRSGSIELFAPIEVVSGEAARELLRRAREASDGDGDGAP